MKTDRIVKKASKARHTIEVLLTELERECEAVLKLLHQLEVVRFPADQREEIIGELSAVITHLHEHTRGLDERILREL